MWVPPEFHLEPQLTAWAVAGGALVASEGTSAQLAHAAVLSQLQCSSHLPIFSLCSVLQTFLALKSKRSVQCSWADLSEIECVQKQIRKWRRQQGVLGYPVVYCCDLHWEITSVNWKRRKVNVRSWKRISPPCLQKVHFSERSHELKSIRING